jgi:hypothetical protein
MALAVSDIVANTTTSDVASGATRTFNLPTSGVSAGMQMWLCICISNSGDLVSNPLSTPTDWDLEGSQRVEAASDVWSVIYRRTVPGGGLGSTINITSSDTAVAHSSVAFAVQNAVLAPNAKSAWNTGSGTTVSHFAATTDVDGCLVLRLSVMDGEGNNDQPVMTSHTAVNWATHSTPGGGEVFVYAAAQASAGSTGNADFTADVADQFGTITIALEESTGSNNLSMGGIILNP